MDNILNCSSENSSADEDSSPSVASKATITLASSASVSTGLTAVNTNTTITTDSSCGSSSSSATTSASSTSNEIIPGSILKSDDDSTTPLPNSNYFSNQPLVSNYEQSPYYLRQPNSILGSKPPMASTDKSQLHDLFQATFPNMESSYWSNFYQVKSETNPSSSPSLTRPSQPYQSSLASGWQSTNSLTSSQWDGILSISKFKETNFPNRNLVDLPDPMIHSSNLDHFTKVTEMNSPILNNSGLPMEKYRIKHGSVTESNQLNDYQTHREPICPTNDCREIGEDLTLNAHPIHRPTNSTVYQTSRTSCEQSNPFYNHQKSLIPPPPAPATAPQSISYFESKYLSNQNALDNPPPSSSSHKQHKGHIKKPLNAFMLFMKEKRTEVMAECTLKESAVINQILGRKWHALSREEQSRYYEQARQEKELHQRLYPGWSARDNYACQARRKKRRTSKSDLFLLTKNHRPEPDSKPLDDKFMLFKGNKAMDMQSRTNYGEHSYHWPSTAKLDYQTPLNVSQPWKKNSLVNYTALRHRDSSVQAPALPETAHPFLVNPYPMGLLSVHSPLNPKASDADEPNEFPKNTCSNLEDVDKFVNDGHRSDKGVYYPDRQVNVSAYSIAKIHKTWVPEDSHHPSAQHDFPSDWLIQKPNTPNSSCPCYSHCPSNPNFPGPESEHPRPVLLNPDWSNPLLSNRNPKPPVPDLLQSTRHPEFSPRQMSSSESFGDRVVGDFESQQDVNHLSVNYNTHVAATVAVAAAAAYALKTNCWSTAEIDVGQSHPRALDYLDNRQTESYSPHTVSTPESSLQVGDELQ